MQLTEPLHLNIEEIFVHQDNARLVTLVNSMEYDLEVEGIEQSCGCVNARLDDTSIRRHKESQLSLFVRPTQVTDRFRQKIVIKLSSPANMSLQIVIEAKIKGPVEITPSTLRFDESSQLQEVIS